VKRTLAQSCSYTAVALVAPQPPASVIHLLHSLPLYGAPAAWSAILMSLIAVVGPLLAYDWDSTNRLQDEAWKMLHASCFGDNLLILLLAYMSTCLHISFGFVCIVVQQVLPRCSTYLIRYLFCEEMYSRRIVVIFHSAYHWKTPGNDVACASLMCQFQHWRAI